MSNTVDVVSHEGYDEITTTRNARIHVTTGRSKYEIRILDGWIDIGVDGHRLIVYPDQPNEISITRSRAKYVRRRNRHGGQA